MIFALIGGKKGISSSLSSFSKQVWLVLCFCSWKFEFMDSNADNLFLKRTPCIFNRKNANDSMCLRCAIKLTWGTKQIVWVGIYFPFGFQESLLSNWKSAVFKRRQVFVPALFYPSPLCYYFWLADSSKDSEMVLHIWRKVCQFLSLHILQKYRAPASSFQFGVNSKQCPWRHNSFK